MKAIMYHYVRPRPEGMPHFRYLHLDDFKRQLDYFAENHGFVARDDFEQAIKSGRDPGPGVVLTFDDGFIDHYRHVTPELAERGLWGIFFIPTGVYTTGRMLNVHRVHYLLGRYGGVATLSQLKKLINPEMLRHAHIKEFHDETYQHVVRDDQATVQVKRILNYFIADQHRTPVLDRMMSALCGELRELEDYYVTRRQIRHMVEQGMLIGSHGVSHRVMSTLSEPEQAEELNRSFAWLDEATGGLGLRCFCYPYGGFHTFSQATERLLDQCGCQFSFNVEYRDVNEVDLRNRPQALPRFDCNLFPHGQASLG